MNPDVPLLSIITVVYNNLEGLQFTFQSLQKQTCKDYEWLVIDGGSTDGTVEWLNQLNFQGLTVVSEQDKGLYDAMNKGLRIASGLYAWFINSGDGIYSENTVKQLQEIKSMPDIIYGETMLIDEHGSEIGTRSDKTTRKLPEKLSAKSMIKGMVVCHQSFITKRAIAPSYNLSYSFSADIDWVISCLERASSVHNYGAILSKYLVGGISAQNQQAGWKERWNIYIAHYGFLYTAFAHVYIVLRYIWKNLFFNKKY